MAGVDLSGADLVIADLTMANLAGAQLAGASLSGAICTGANLSGAYLAGADLSAADTEFTRLDYADLADADLSAANVMYCELGSANLSGARFITTNLTSASFNHARLDGAYVGWSLLVDVNLSPFCNAEPSVVHQGPSYVDVTSIIKSIRAPNLKEFLCRAGGDEFLVENVIESARALGTSVFSMRSAYLIFGRPDECFARKIYRALQQEGFRCFFFPEHAVPGEKVHRTMRKGIANHDRVILICSRTSLDRDGVLFEIDEVLTREAKMKGESLLIPIRLDRYVLDEWKTEREDVTEAVRSRVVADFEGADQDDEKFQAGLRKLLGALRK